MDQEKELLPKVYEVNINKLEAFLHANKIFISDIKKKDKEKIFGGDFDIEVSEIIDHKEENEVINQVKSLDEIQEEADDYFMYQQLTFL